MRWSEFSFLTRLLSALWYFFLDAYRGSMWVARAVRSVLSLGSTRNALVLIFTNDSFGLGPACGGPCSRRHDWPGGTCGQVANPGSWGRSGSRIPILIPR